VSKLCKSVNEGRYEDIPTSIETYRTGVVMKNVGVQKHSSLNQVFTMQAIKPVVFFALSFASACTFASTDKDCLNHLGGAFANVECFNGLSLDLIKENEVISNKIISTIPKNNKNYNLFRQYIRAQKDSKKYCELSRDAMNS
jgi:hypothetical protein